MSRLEAGRELDALVAEKVMGWRVVLRESDRPGVVYFDNGDGGGHLAPAYSTDIRAAWDVLEKMSGANNPTGPHIDSVILNTPHGPGQFPDDVPLGKWSIEWFDGVETLMGTDADTAPLAICLAALKAVGADSLENGTP